MLYPIIEAILGN